jgi:hypothetical protein
MIFRWLAGLFRHSGPEHPPLVAVKERVTGESIERALDKFEDRCSAENYQTLKIQEQFARADGTLVRFEVRWKYSVFDDDNSGFHESWALVASADPAAGDPPDARFYVVSATAKHHNL